MTTRVLLLGTFLCIPTVVLTTACTSTPVRTEVLPPAMGPGPIPGLARDATASLSIPGVPPRPELVTVVPFVHNQESQGTGFVMVEGEVDGHRGVLILDTGAPFFELNSAFVQRSPAGGIDTVRGGSPTATVGTQLSNGVSATVHTFRVGTITIPIDSIGVGATSPMPSNTQIVAAGFPILGNMGLNAMEPFETIVDYVHQRVVFIRLDKTGRRLLDVPAYAPMGSVRLRPYSLGPEWGIFTHSSHPKNDLDAMIHVLLVDTGTSGKDVVDPDEEQMADQLKQAIAAGHSPTDIDLERGKQKSVFDSQMFPVILGSPFLTHLGVVGWNLRTHQLILYH